MSLPRSLQAEDHGGRRKLVALLLASAGLPSIAWLWILGGISSAALVGTLVSISAVLYLLFVRVRGGWVWVYPLGVCPLLTCLAGAELSDPPSLFTSWLVGSTAVATVMTLAISLVASFQAEQHRQALTAAREATADAQSALAAANDAAKTRERFLANMTHELRTPLTGIIGMAQLLPPSAEPEVHEVMSTISSSANSLLEIVNDLLSFSKGRSGTLELRAAPFAPADVIHDATRSLVSQAHQKHLELLLDLAPNLPSAMMGDELRFRQVIINLVGNALKFTEEGTVTVRVFLGTTPLSLVGEIIDTGIGIPPERLAHVFEPFVQVDDSPSRRSRGTGLGLTITRQLVELMGGTVEVESELERGSVFRFQIPLNPADTRVPLVVIDRWLDDRRLALVAGRAGARGFLRKMLESAGATILEPERLGVLAVELQRQRSAGRPIDAAVVDFSPDAAWHDVAEAAKWVPVVALVAPEQRAALTLGELTQVTLIDKPYSAQELHDVFRSLPLGAVGRERRATERRPGSGLDVLVAEDNAINARVAQGFLARLGHRSTVVQNGVEALRALALRHFDAVLMDLEMPEMDGLEATRRIRAQEAQSSLAHLPVFIVSANALSEDEAAGAAAGADAFLIKPIGLARLEAALAHLGPVITPKGEGT